MGPSPLRDLAYSDQERDLLLKTAADSIDCGLLRNEPASVRPHQFPPALQKPGACFVTLHLHGQLRGCIGTTEAYRPLIRDVAENAFAASQRDPRFSPLTLEELPDTQLSLSILTEPARLAFRNEEHLLEQLVPGLDGLIIQEGRHRATFLPQVWDQVPDKHEFLDHLKRKAGMRTGRESHSLIAHRYQVLHIP